MNHITPNGLRILRKQMRVKFSSARRFIADARALTDDGWLNERSAALLSAYLEHDDARRCLRQMTAPVVKYGAISETAKQRILARRTPSASSAQPFRRT